MGWSPIWAPCVFFDLSLLLLLYFHVLKHLLTVMKNTCVKYLILSFVGVCQTLTEAFIVEKRVLLLLFLRLIGA